MSKIEQIITDYQEFIDMEVIDNFGGSYQNYQTLGNVWRQKMNYAKPIEDFVIFKTKLFIRLLDKSEKNNLNMMYKVCNNMADYVAEYTAKKSADLTSVSAKEDIMKHIFFDSGLFVSRFKQVYANRQVNESSRGNRGTIEMAKYLKFLQR